MKQDNDIFKIQPDNANLGDLARNDLQGQLRQGIAVGHRLRIAQSLTLFSSRFGYDNLPALFHPITNTGGTITYNPNRDSNSLAIGTAAGDKIYYSTNEYFHYQSYRETHAATAVLLPEFQSGQRVRFGPFYENNGAYLERDQDGTFNIVRRTKATGTVTEERIPQKDWSGDTFLGTGPSEGKWRENPSGLTINKDTMIMVAFDILWYAGGHIDVSFLIDGRMHHAHRFRAGNNMTQPIIGEPTVPFRFEIENLTAVSAAREIEIFGVSANSDGGNDAKERGEDHSISNGITAVTVGNANYSRVLTIRPKATFKGKPNRVKITPSGFGIFAQGKNCSFLLVRDADLTGITTWNDVGLDSSVEYSVQTNALSGGVIRGSGYVAAGNNATGRERQLTSARNPLVLRADGVQDGKNLAIFAQTLTAGDSDVYGDMDWTEII